MRDVRGTAIIVKEALPEWQGVDSTSLDKPGKIDPIPSPYQMEPECDSQDKDKKSSEAPEASPIVIQPAEKDKEKRKFSIIIVIIGHFYLGHRG